MNVQIALFQDLEIVRGASGTSHRENQTGDKADNQQSFYRMSLFFPE